MAALERSRGYVLLRSPHPSQIMLETPAQVQDSVPRQVPGHKRWWESCTMLLSADNESDLTRASPRAWQPLPHGNEEGESFPSGVALGRTCPLRRSFSMSGVVPRNWHETFRQDTSRIPGALICGNAVAIGSHDAATKNTLTSGQAPPGSAESGRIPTSNGCLRPTPPRPCLQRAGASRPCKQQTIACRRMTEEFSFVQLQLTGAGSSGRAGDGSTQVTETGFAPSKGKPKTTRA